MRGQMAYLNGAAGSAGKQAAHFFLQRTFQALPNSEHRTVLWRMIDNGGRPTRKFCWADELPRDSARRNDEHEKRRVFGRAPGLGH